MVAEITIVDVLGGITRVEAEIGAGSIRVHVTRTGQGHLLDRRHLHIGGKLTAD
jgi:hypothetical protein